jgi:fumarate reductase iron-sulfur subunit
MVNGRPVLACETNAFGYLTSGLTVAPLARIPVERDLITDVDGFITRLKQSLTWLIGHEDASGINRQTPAELEAYRKLSECINCLLCYAACPVLPVLAPSGIAAQEAEQGQSAAKTKATSDTDPEFYGPAALALASRWDLDSRDAGADQRDEAIAETEHGIWACSQDGSCTRVCPKGIDPKGAISLMQKTFLA